MSQPSAQVFVGALLTAAGLLLATLSGLCSLSLLGPSVHAVLQGSAPAGSLTSALVLVGLFGGLPFAGGVVLIVVGLRLIRRPRGPVP